MSSQPHIIRGNVIECKKVLLCNKHYISKRKRFVSGIPPNSNENENALKVFYQKYGEVEYTIIMTDRVKEKHRGNYEFNYIYIYIGIGFIVFKDDESAEPRMSDVKQRR